MSDTRKKVLSLGAKKSGESAAAKVEEREWIRSVGHRDVPGRPELFGTTKTFLDYFGLKSLDELPPLAELKDIPELEPQLPFDNAPVVANAAMALENDADAEADAEAEADDDAGDEAGFAVDTDEHAGASTGDHDLRGETADDPDESFETHDEAGDTAAPEQTR